MKIGPFVSYIKWPVELYRQRLLRVHSVFSTVCTFVSARPFFPKIVRFIFPVESVILARVCYQYTADCNVLTLRRSSCISTLPLFVPQTKDGPYLNLNPQALPLPGGAGGANAPTKYRLGGQGPPNPKMATAT